MHSPTVSHRLARYEHRGFFVVERLYPPGALMGRHGHEEPYLSFLLRGSFAERAGRSDSFREPGNLLFRPSGWEHSARFSDTPVRILNVVFEPTWLNRIEEAGPGPLRAASVISALGSALGSRLAGELHRPDAVSPLAVEGIVLEMLAEGQRVGRPRSIGTMPPWLSKARERLHDEMNQSPSLSALARSVGVHPSHLARVFRQRLGCTMGEYLRRIRVDFAAELLAGSDRPLAQIALEAGFADQSHFSRLFRRMTGLTPAQFRASSLSR